MEVLDEGDKEYINMDEWMNEEDPKEHKIH